jgi:hypothetical protein
VTKGERGRGRSPSLGEGSSGSREVEGEGGEGFYIARKGRRPDLLVTPGGEETMILLLLLFDYWKSGALVISADKRDGTAWHFLSPNQKLEVALQRKGDRNRWVLFFLDPFTAVPLAHFCVASQTTLVCVAFLERAAIKRRRSANRHKYFVELGWGT